jgi:hypothetical protein
MIEISVSGQRTGTAWPEPPRVPGDEAAALAPILRRPHFVG